MTVLAFPAVDYFLSRENGYLTLMKIIRILHFKEGEWHAACVNCEEHGGSTNGVRGDYKLLCQLTSRPCVIVG